MARFPGAFTFAHAPCWPAARSPATRDGGYGDCCGGFGWSPGFAPVVALSKRSALPGLDGCRAGSLRCACPVVPGSGFVGWLWLAVLPAAASAAKRKGSGAGSGEGRGLRLGRGHFLGQFRDRRLSRFLGTAAGGVAFFGEDVAVAVAMMHRDPLVRDCVVEPALEIAVAHVEEVVRRSVPPA